MNDWRPIETAPKDGEAIGEPLAIFKARGAVPILSVLRRGTARRFRAKLVTKGECLEFCGSRNKRGYGFVEVSYDYKKRRYPILAHRLAWALEWGEDPPLDRIVCHTCNNPSCCNPEHLYLGTEKTNAEDCAKAGRRPIGSAHVLHGVKGPRHPASRYTVEQRRWAIDRLTKGRTRMSVAKEIGASNDTVGRWWREFEALCGKLGRETAMERVGISQDKQSD